MAASSSSSSSSSSSTTIVDISKLPDDKGSDTEGAEYSSIADLWNHELGRKDEDHSNKASEWYTKAIDYWSGVPATVDGMMGGLTEISQRDLRASHDFLSFFLSGKCPGRKATSPTHCGAGIGRVTQNLLLPLFDTVDMVEQCDSFVEEAKKRIKNSKMGHFYCSGLQTFQFEQQYDIIWIQWVIGHLHDEDLIVFLKKCKQALAPNGLLCIKDNTCEHGFVMDKQDSSVTRSDNHFRALFTQAGMDVVRTLLQTNFPKKLFPVRMYALS